MVESAIDARGLTKRFGTRTVVDSVDLQLPAGSALGLVGPNGAGKTTVIKMMLGIVLPSAGKATLFGAPSSVPLSRRRVGYLPERLFLPEVWTPVDHLRSVARLKGVEAGEPEALLEEVGLEAAAFRRPMKGFSKGMAQRVGLATALVGDPELVILDEPTDGVDPLGRMRIRELLSERVRRGATVLLNSHLLAETERICDRVAILHRGRLLAAGTLEELQKRGRPTARFADHPNLQDMAARHGLREVSGGGYVVADDPSSAAMSRAVGQLLAAGHVLLSLSEGASDLESVLREAIEPSEEVA